MRYHRLRLDEIAAHNLTARFSPLTVAQYIAAATLTEDGFYELADDRLPELLAAPSPVSNPKSETSSPGDVDSALAGEARRAGLPPPCRGCGG